MSDNVISFKDFKDKSDSDIEDLIELIRENPEGEFLAIMLVQDSDVNDGAMNVLRSPFTSRAKMLGCVEYLKEIILRPGELTRDNES